MTKNENMNTSGTKQTTAENSVAKSGFDTNGPLWVKKFKLRDGKFERNLDSVTYFKSNSAEFRPAVCTKVEVSHRRESVPKNERISLSA